MGVLVSRVYALYGENVELLPENENEVMTTRKKSGSWLVLIQVGISDPWLVGSVY